MRRLIRLGLICLVGLGALAGAAFALDGRAHEDRVNRGVTLAGVPVGGLRQDRLAAVVDDVSGRIRTAQVTVEAPGGGFTAPAETLLQVSPPATVRSVMRVGRTGSPVTRFLAWAGSFVSPRQAPVRISVNGPAVRRAVDELDHGPRRAPEEPDIAFEKGAFVAVEGRPGTGIDPGDVIRGLPVAARRGLPIVVEVDRADIPPTIPLAEARRLAGEAQTRVTKGLAVMAGTRVETVPAATVRTWVSSEAAGGGLRLVLDRPRAVADLEKLLAEPVDAPVETRFTVEGTNVGIVPGKDGTGCCDPAAGGAVERAVLGSARTPVELPLRPRSPKLSAAAAAELGVKEPVGSYETRHAGGQPRVRNIHRIADLVRGQVIAPGATFSVNGFVGRRTAEAGFVAAPIIEDGVFAEGVGGGVSQFATTLFNAAFFAGLDFEEYQAHSIYISRYPYGREATLNYPRPDLRIRNTTPHGILIWPTYTERSIKVTLFSTRFVEGAQTGQTTAPSGACTRVNTERTRTYVADGRKEVDRVIATYRPGEGVNC